MKQNGNVDFQCVCPYDTQDTTWRNYNIKTELLNYCWDDIIITVVNNK